VGFKSNSRQWLTNESMVLKRTERTIGQVIKNRANMIAPVLSGDLVESGRVVDDPLGGVSVIYGGASAPHARRRHFENKLHPQTLNYLKRAGDSVKKEGIKKYMDMNR